MGSVSDTISLEPVTQKWRCVINKVLTLLKISKYFHTLRDRREIVIQEDCLKFLKKQGSGQFGIVVKCAYKGQFIAVKYLKQQYLNTSDESLFTKEVKLLKKLHHPNVISYIGTFHKMIDGRKQLCVAMESMEGDSLHSLLLKQCIILHKQLYSIMDAYNWVLDIAKGMQYLHNSRPIVLHRDLKLQNIMLNPKSERIKAVIVDFGVHTLITKNSMKTDVYNLTGKTGSYSYMAPEVFLNKPYNEKVDVYSYGIIVFELFSRFVIQVQIAPSGTPQEIINYAKKAAIGARQKIPESWPQQLQNLIQLCWNQDPKLRPSFDLICEKLLQMQPEILEWFQTESYQRKCCALM